MEKFTTTDITKGLAIPFGRLREWIVKGFIKPSFPSQGQGKAAEFTIEDCYKIQAFRTMVESGFSRETAASYIRLIGDISLIDFVFIRRGEKAITYSKVISSGTTFEVPSGTVDDLSRDTTMKACGTAHIDLERGIFSLNDNEIDEDDLEEGSDNWQDFYIINVARIQKHVNSKMKGG